MQERVRICEDKGATLSSYGRRILGALVPVAKPDFGCRGPLFGGEVAEKEATLDPGGETV